MDEPPPDPAGFSYGPITPRLAKMLDPLDIAIMRHPGPPSEVITGQPADPESRSRYFAALAARRAEEAASAASVPFDPPPHGGRIEVDERTLREMERRIRLKAMSRPITELEVRRLLNREFDRLRDEIAEVLARPTGGAI